MLNFYSMDVSANKQWALYQPILERFMLTSSNKQCCEEILKLSSSRYSLFLCRIDDALLKNNLMLDNFNCNLYKPKNVELQIDFSLAPVDWCKEFNFDQIEKSTKNVDFYSVDNELKWLQFIYQWIDFLNYIEVYKEPIPFNLIPDFVEPKVIENNLIKLPYQYFKQIKQFKKNVRQYIYHGDNIVSVKQQIQLLIENLCVIKEIYQEWQNQ